MNNEALNYVFRQVRLKKPIALLAIMATETSGEGFSSDGKILIQFEPTYFKKFTNTSKGTVWRSNGVGNQAQEWAAFNDAYKISPIAAMKSTSIGMSQIMGCHYDILGFKTVEAMWDDAKKGITNQVNQLISFILSNKTLLTAINTKNWTLFAKTYNGPMYKRNNYDVKLKNNYERYQKLFPHYTD